MNSRGFSLMTVLIATALSSVILVGIMRMVNIGAKSQRNLSSLGTMGNLVKEVSFFLQNSSACESYFSGRTFNPSAASLSSEVIPHSSSSALLEIHYPDDPTRIYLNEGMELENGLQITRLYLKDFIQNGAQRYTAQFTMTAQLPSGLVVSRNIPVNFTTKNNSPTEEEIVSCGSSSTATATGSVGWVAVPCNIDHVAYCRTGGDVSSEQLCVDAGYTTFSGSCKGVYSGRTFQGTLMSNDSYGYWTISCLWGWGSFSTPSHLLCIR